VIQSNDPFCRGIVMLGLEAPEEKLGKAFEAAASTSLVKGFAVGRTIFADAAADWLAGKITDEAATNDMAERFKRLVALWQKSRATYNSSTT
jgi:5-dehydro-2-deoxygluconokinase